MAWASSGQAVDSQVKGEELRVKPLSEESDRAGPVLTLNP